VPKPPANLATLAAGTDTGVALLPPAKSDAAYVAQYTRARILAARAGHAVAVATLADASAALGENVRLADDGRTILAAVPGRAVLRDGKVSVEPTLEFRSDLGAAFGPIDFPGDVTVGRDLLDNAKLSCDGALTVGGAIEAATVRAGGALVVDGGILGKHRGVVAAATVRAHFIDRVTVTAAGDVACHREIAASTVIASGKIDIPNGTIIGGRLVANAGVFCGSLGNAAGVRTVVEVGVDEAFRTALPACLAAVDAQQARARRMEQSVAPLLALGKTLSEAQKERATQLIYEASEATEQAARAATDLQERQARAAEAARAEVHVADVLYPGVVILLPGYQVEIATPFQGPLIVCLRGGTGGLPEVCVVEPGGGGLQVLSAQSRPEDPPSTTSARRAA